MTYEKDKEWHLRVRRKAYKLARLEAFRSERPLVDVASEAIVRAYGKKSKVL